MWITGAIVDATFCDVSKPSCKRTDAILDATYCNVIKPSRKRTDAILDVTSVMSVSLHVKSQE